MHLKLAASFAEGHFWVLVLFAFYMMQRDTRKQQQQQAWTAAEAEATKRHAAAATRGNNIRHTAINYMMALLKKCCGGGGGSFPLLLLLVLLVSIMINVWVFVATLTQQHMALDVSVLKELLAGSSSSSSSNTVMTTTTTTSPACDNFFSVLSNAWLDDPDDKSDENNMNNAIACNATYYKYRDLIAEQNTQMGRMNATLTLFTSWSADAWENDPACRLLQDDDDGTSSSSSSYANIRVRNFDPEPLLLKHGFTAQHIGWMKGWRLSGARFNHYVTRLSDIFRIALQAEYGMAYTDLDIVYLSDHKEIYLSKPNVALPIWSEEQGALEVQNSAFCFNTEQNHLLLNKARHIMESLGDLQTSQNKYMYTQFGPNLFQHSIQELQGIAPVQLYYTHSDDHWKVEVVEAQYRNYGRTFVWLHLDRSNRRRNWYAANKSQSYQQLVQRFRQACSPPPQWNHITQRVVFNTQMTTTTS